MRTLRYLSRGFDENRITALRLRGNHKWQPALLFALFFNPKSNKLMPKTSGLRLIDRYGRFSFTAAGCFIFLLLFCSAFSLKAMAAPNSAMKSYVDKYRGLAEKKAAKYSIPANVILAVAIVESGSGKTTVASEFHNHFGMAGKNHLKRKTRYKSYPTVEASYDHFCKHLAKQRFYRKLSKGADNRAWVMAISRIGYSDRPKVWEKKLLLVLKEIRGL